VTGRPRGAHGEAIAEGTSSELRARGEFNVQPLLGSSEDCLVVVGTQFKGIPKANDVREGEYDEPLQQVLQSPSGYRGTLLEYSRAPEQIHVGFSAFKSYF